MATAARRRPAKRGRRGVAPVRSAEKDTLEHYERFAGTLKLLEKETGDIVPFVLQDWERAVAEDYFAGYAETIAEVPTGQGKTTFFGTIALHHGTFVRRNCRALILSSAGKQAQRMYEAIAGFVDLSPDLQRWWKPQMYGLGRIKSLVDRGVIEIVSPELTVVEGEDMSLVLSDEIHRHPGDGAAHSVLVTKLQKQGARILGCTTAGDDLESFLGRKRKQALETPGMIVVGHLAGIAKNQGKPGSVARAGEYYTVARDPEKDISWHEWSLPEDADPDDLDEVLKANPSTFVTKENLRRSWKLLRTRPWDWLRQHCCLWALGENSAIDPPSWRENFRIEWTSERKLKKLAGCEKWIGFDMGGVDDSTGIVPVWRLPDEHATDGDGNQVLDEKTRQPKLKPPRFVTARGRIVWPPGDGQWTLVDDVIAALDKVWALPGINQGIVFDHNRGGGYVTQDLERKRSWTIISHGQSKEMDEASELLARVVIEGQLEHDGDEAITRQVLGASAQKSRRNSWYLAKPRSAKHRKIDAAVALAMALRVANSRKKKRKLRMIGG